MYSRKLSRRWKCIVSVSPSPTIGTAGTRKNECSAARTPSRRRKLSLMGEPLVRHKLKYIPRTSRLMKCRRSYESSRGTLRLCEHQPQGKLQEHSLSVSIVVRNSALTSWSTLVCSLSAYVYYNNSFHLSHSSPLMMCCPISPSRCS